MGTAAGSVSDRTLTTLALPANVRSLTLPVLYLLAEVAKG